MHPIERLRLVARADGDGSSALAREAAVALATFRDDPAGLVTACRRLVDRQPTNGAVWWLAARVLVADDPDGEAWRAAEELDDDATSGVLVDALPEDATVTVVGWSETVARALMARGDVRALVVDACGEAAALVRYLTRAGGDAAVVPEGGVGAAAAASDLVVLEASAMGGDGFVALAGSRAAAAVARSVDTQVLAVAPLGHVVPTPMWHALRVVLDDDDPWDDHEEVVPLDVVDAVVRPFGVVAPAEAVAAPDCGMAPELLRRVS